VRQRIARWRAGRLEFLERSAGLPELGARAFLEDSRGRLWIGLRSGGVSVSDDPAAERPAFRNFGARAGLASETVWALAEDSFGRIYLGTGRGLDRLDPATGTVEHLGDPGGLGSGQVNALCTDRSGNVWIASSTGLSRLSPREGEARSRPQEVFLGGVAIAGVELALPERGAQSLELAPLPSGTTVLRLDWVAPCLRAGSGPRFQYRLGGAEESWSAPSPERGVSFASLGSGRYLFEVQSLDEHGTPGTPATLRFEVLPPFWRSAWFLGTSALLAAALLYAAHRARVRRILALERLRRQIAADVHDDVGAGLAQIAVLTEVARNRTSGEARSQLEEVARLARTLRESMSDIVWAVDPRRDTLGDLVQRVRQVAYNLFADESVRFELRAPAAEGFERTTLAPDLRRHLLLASKELLSNAARHAGASRVELELALESGSLLLCVADDGRGFDAAAPRSGHGLDGLRERARALRGVLEIESAGGRGTRVRLRVPLAAPA
jgi:signal transduction histidine kinase